LILNTKGYKHKQVAHFFKPFKIFKMQKFKKWLEEKVTIKDIIVHLGDLLAVIWTAIQILHHFQVL